MTEPLHAALRGVVGAMAMTGMRRVTEEIGLLSEPPPETMLRRTGRIRIPRRQRKVPTELLHWGVGAMGGLGYGLLPEGVRRRRWSGPAYGLVVWLSYGMAAAPALGLPHAKRPSPKDHLALAADHILYGLVLSGLEARPREEHA